MLFNVVFRGLIKFMGIAAMLLDLMSKLRFFKGLSVIGMLFCCAGWGSAPSPDERDEGAFILRRRPLAEEIPVLPKDAFETLGVCLGGSTRSYTTFIETCGRAVWIAKAQVKKRAWLEGGSIDVDREMTASAACQTKIAFDVYRFYGVLVPETVLSIQEFSNMSIEDIEALEGLKGQEVIHILSRKIEDYHDYKKQPRFSGFIESLHPESGPMILHENICDIEACHDSGCAIEAYKGESVSSFTLYDVEGLGRAAAVATWVHDINFIGASATNIGYCLSNRESRSFAEMIMNNPAKSFSDPKVYPYPEPRHIRFAIPGNKSTHTIAFERLFPEGSRSRDEFLMTLHAIINTDERTIVHFFARDGGQLLRGPRSVPGLRRQLMARKEELRIHYAPELEASQSKYGAAEIAITRLDPMVTSPSGERGPLPPPFQSGGARPEVLEMTSPRAALLAAVGGAPAVGGTLGSPVIIPPLPTASVPRLLGRAIPDVARGFEAEYEQFLRMMLVYKPNHDNDTGRVYIPVHTLTNPLFGRFDLSAFGDTGKYMSIHTGYRKGKIPTNKDKVEIWICPKFLAAQEMTTTAAHLAPIMSGWDDPVGYFWTWGNWDSLKDYHHSIKGNMYMTCEKTLYNLSVVAMSRASWNLPYYGEWAAWEKASEKFLFTTSA